MDDDIIELAALCARDPLRWARCAYDWGVGELAGKTGPRLWQADVLGDIRDHLSGPDRFEPLMLAVASGHGIGKSALVGMVVDWALSTCEDAKVLITANTDTQLRTKTSPEVGAWQRRSLTAGWFAPGIQAITSRDAEHERTWRADFVPWSEHNTEAFAGLHNVGKRIVLIFDEASAIADKVWEVAEGALTDEGTEILWLAFGNPTRNTGRFRECFRRYKHRWKHRQIDSRTVEGTNKVQIAKWAADYGEDSDFFKTRVRGLFPTTSAKQFISEADVEAAYGRVLRPEQYNFAPKILTLDPAWTGDDELVIGLRQGLAFKVLYTCERNDNDVAVAQRFAALEDEHQADAAFLDAGYGTGIKSVGDTWGRDWQLVWFAGESSDPGCLNKRAQIWRDMRDWLKQGGAIPQDPQLRDELTGVEQVERLDGKVLIESKKAVRERIGVSPGRADALAISFAYPATRKADRGARTRGDRRDHDPYANL